MFDELLPELLGLLGPFGARPDVPIEAEQFFAGLATQFSDQASYLEHIAANLPTWFRCLDARPEWLQGPEWQWWAGKPMVFVGSINAPRGTFHDDGRFYVFWCPESGIARTMIQVA
jgi:hypothetical protein